MHPKIREAIEQIDAALFSGDTFYDPDDNAELLEHARAWVKELESIRDERPGFDTDNEETES